jgi:hypothetical protein
MQVVVISTHIFIKQLNPNEERFVCLYKVPPHNTYNKLLLATQEMNPEKIAYQKLQALTYHMAITLALKEALIATISL